MATWEVVVDQVVAAYPLAQADVLAAIVPSEFTWRQRVEAPPRLEMMRLVVEAVPETVKAVEDAYEMVARLETTKLVLEAVPETERAVVLAYGKVEAVVVVAVKYAPTT